jgi:hypothetical protein
MYIQDGNVLRMYLYCGFCEAFYILSPEGSLVRVYKNDQN